MPLQPLSFLIPPLKTLPAAAAPAALIMSNPLGNATMPPGLDDLLGADAYYPTTPPSVTHTKFDDEFLNKYERVKSAIKREDLCYLSLLLQEESELQEEVKKLQEEVEKLQEEEEEVQELQEEVQELQEEEEELEERVLFFLPRNIKKLQEELEEKKLKEEEVKKLQEESEKKRALLLLQQEVKKLQEESEEKKLKEEEVKKLQEEVKKLLEESEEKRALLLLQQEVKKLQEESEEKKREVEKLQEESEEKKRALLLHQQEVKELQEKVKKLHEKLEKKRALVLLQQEVKKLQEESEKKRARLERGVNLSGEPLLSVVISCGKTKLAVWLVAQMSADALTVTNESYDTPLHVAAEMGDSIVAEAIIDHYCKCNIGKDKAELLGAQNKWLEMPLHKAALFGNKEVFFKLAEHGGQDYVHIRGKEGASVLHCAVMSGNFDLALEIAQRYPDLWYSRNNAAITPLQLIVSIPTAFRSMQTYGPRDSIIYKCIPLKGSTPCSIGRGRDEENQQVNENLNEGCVHDNLQGCQRYFPPIYDSCFDFLAIFWNLVKGIQDFVFKIAKKVCPKIQWLEQEKQNHKKAMELIKLIAKDKGYWEFLERGWGHEGKRQASLIRSDAPSPSLGRQIRRKLEEITLLAKGMKYLNLIANESMAESGDRDSLQMELGKLRKKVHQTIKDIVGSTTEQMTVNDNRRWNESPLTLGAKMGLDEFVEQILMVRPEAALVPDLEGKNVLQVAIEHGHEKIVDILKSMTTGHNPKLPKSLISSLEDKTRNTILHFATEKTVSAEEATALQMQYELQWFEKVKQMTPQDLIYSRNVKEMTAHEVFTLEHKDMLKKCKDQITEMGKTCAGIVAAVVFASSFSIPGERTSNNIPAYHNKTAFKVFSNAYVVGLSCASTAMVLFLSLLTSRYRESDFRRSIPTTYILAIMSFFLALVSLLVAFSCNIYLNIYGYRKAGITDVLPFACELAIIPLSCLLTLFYRGGSFSFVRQLKRAWQ